MKMGKLMDVKIHLLKSGFIQAPLSSVLDPARERAVSPPQERVQSAIPVSGKVTAD